MLAKETQKQQELTGRDQLIVFRRLLKYLVPHKKMLILAMGLLILTVLGDVLGPLLIKIFIDDYLTPGNFPTGPIIGLAGAYLFIQTSNVIISYFQLLKFQEAALKIIQQLRIDAFAKVHGLGMRYFDQTPAGGIVSRVTNDTEAIKEMFVTVLIGFIQSAFLIVGVYIAMFFLNFRLALITLLLLPILGWIIYLYRKYSSVFYQDLRERLGQLNAKLSESIQGMGMIQAFGQETRLKDEFNEINDKHWQAGKRNIKIDGLLLRPAIDLVYALALIMLLSYFGITSFSNTVEVGVIYAFVTYIDRFFEPINQVMQRLSIFQQAIVAASRVFLLLDEQEKAPRQFGTAGEITNGEIEFRNVSFSYDGNKEVLKNISFKAKPGQTIALVGHTGSGKSSIINLLLRFYEFEKGEILIDGNSVKEYETDELRRKMGLVLQDPFLFYGTIASNIRLYDQTLTDDEVRKASVFVQANPFIETLPQGYNQQVTERGSTFSSGQRQLVAFARTMATDPKILVLDEATANIDTETEVAIQASLERMRRGRTTIAIAHRLSTIQDADLILVLHNGEIVEQGTHQQLLYQRGLYHKMYLLQNGIVE
ncbi:ABC transporter ATP-binding protein [Microbacterium sp. APC 3898]|uniref:ABC transporter ATP-binding protein n=1 Tax=Planococcus notacanthi TaxID=3035188 RepID=A0ABT7ZHX1_9BACL|nr:MULTISPECIES: ABC transporter ATP-binding protein [Terrabacteria group]MDN3426753.1 ABC transporter ATP-binding protein [Planococcus sp. APC 4016]MDN3438008.1 ABC transporter ATP-binding protein [Planococcus sp. APC 3900]MDN3500263.1 ABC transporter ATP-binding protein [Microbacterium sp. APC 3898]